MVGVTVGIVCGIVRVVPTAGPSQFTCSAAEMKQCLSSAVKFSEDKKRNVFQITLNQIIEK